MNSESDELNISVLEVNRYSSYVFPAFSEKYGTARSLENSQKSPREKE
jgi:hypothetical protein